MSSRLNSFVGLYEPMTSLRADVGGPVKVRWMLSEGVDAERAGPSTSIGVADIAGGLQILKAPGFGTSGFDGGQTWSTQLLQSCRSSSQKSRAAVSCALSRSASHRSLRASMSAQSTLLDRQGF